MVWAGEGRVEATMEVAAGAEPVEVSTAAGVSMAREATATAMARLEVVLEGRVED